MPVWLWTILLSLAGALALLHACQQLARAVSLGSRRDPAFDPAPGWYVRCTRCRRVRSLASVGGVRIGGNRGALAWSVGYCRGCKGLRFIRVIHESRMTPDEVARGRATDSESRLPA